MIFFLTLARVFAAEWPENRCQNQRRIFVLSWGHREFPLCSLLQAHLFYCTTVPYCTMYTRYDRYNFTLGLEDIIHQNNNPICGSLVRLRRAFSIHFCCIPGTFMWWQDQEGAIPHALQSGFWSPSRIDDGRSYTQAVNFGLDTTFSIFKRDGRPSLLAVY